jgi:hypothetical protein
MKRGWRIARTPKARKSDFGKGGAISLYSASFSAKLHHYPGIASCAKPGHNAVGLWDFSQARRKKTSRRLTAAGETWKLYAQSGGC